MWHVTRVLAGCRLAENESTKKDGDRNLWRASLRWRGCHGSVFPAFGGAERCHDPRRAQGKRYPLPYLLLFTVLALLSGARSYRGVITFLEQRHVLLNQHFGTSLKRALVVNTLCGSFVHLADKKAAQVLTGVILTADAMHCQKTFEAARDIGNILISQIKGNQQTLLDTVAAICADEAPADTAETVDRWRHGRQEHRRVETFGVAGSLPDDWNDLIVTVGSTSCAQGMPIVESLQLLVILMTTQDRVKRAKGVDGYINYSYCGDLSRLCKAEKGTEVFLSAVYQSGTSRIRMLSHKDCPEEFVYPTQPNYVFDVIRRYGCGREDRYTYEYHRDKTETLLRRSRADTVDRIVDVCYHPIFQTPNRVLTDDKRGNKTEEVFIYDNKGKVVVRESGKKDNLREFFPDIEQYQNLKEIFVDFCRGRFQFCNRLSESVNRKMVYKEKSNLLEKVSEDGLVTEYFYDDHYLLSRVVQKYRSIDVRYDNRGNISALREGSTAILIYYENRFYKPKEILVKGL
ncbi:hypothetical protein CCP2SC5_1300004 [Azospirillaceae bacterium]